MNIRRYRGYRDVVYSNEAESDDEIGALVSRSCHLLIPIWLGSMQPIGDDVSHLGGLVRGHLHGGAGLKGLAYSAITAVSNDPYSLGCCAYCSIGYGAELIFAFFYGRFTRAPGQARQISTNERTRCSTQLVFR